MKKRENFFCLAVLLSLIHSMSTYKRRQRHLADIAYHCVCLQLDNRLTNLVPHFLLLNFSYFYRVFTNSISAFIPPNQVPTHQPSTFARYTILNTACWSLIRLCAWQTCRRSCRPFTAHPYEKFSHENQRRLD